MADEDYGLAGGILSNHSEINLIASIIIQVQMNTISSIS